MIHLLLHLLTDFHGSRGIIRITSSNDWIGALNKKFLTTEILEFIYLDLLIHFEIIGIILNLFDYIHTLNLYTHKHPRNSLHRFHKHFNTQTTIFHFFDNIHKHLETFTYTDIHIRIRYTKMIDLTTYKIQNYTSTLYI